MSSVIVLLLGSSSAAAFICHIAWNALQCMKACYHLANAAVTSGPAVNGLSQLLFHVPDKRKLLEAA